MNALVDVTLNDDDGLPNLVCEVQANSCKFRDGSSLRLENHTWVASRWRAWKITCWKSELALHAIILSWQVYYIESELWRHITRKNQKIARTPHILGRLNACTNSVYQALLRFSRTSETRQVVHQTNQIVCTTPKGLYSESTERSYQTVWLGK